MVNEMKARQNKKVIKTASDIDHVQEGMLKTPFYSRIAALNWSHQWTEWNGYAIASMLQDDYTEYYSIRNTCGVYDVTPMCKYRIRGREAEAMLNRMVVRDVSKQRLNTVMYTVWCTDRGRVIDDGTIFRFSQDDFRLYCAEPALDWLLMSAEGYDELEIFEETADVAGLALQGPTSCALLKAIGLSGIENLKPFEIKEFNIPSLSTPQSVMISRTGFTGDLGYELWVNPEIAGTLWDILFDVGELYGIHCFGEYALDLARLEAGFILPEVEFHGALHTTILNHDQTPFELSLDWMVNFDKSHFNGRTALLKEKETGPAYRLLKLDVQGEKPAEDAMLYADKACETEIGYVTSAANSPATKANIALGMVKSDYVDGPIYTEIYFQKELKWSKKIAKCTVQSKPFWQHSRSRKTPPDDF